jgi:hypothetical protein
MTEVVEAVTLTEVVDRDGRFWTQDCVNDERGWFPYPQDEPYLSLADLAAAHGPLTPAVHVRRDAPGPVPGPLPGVCFSCGGTGEVHGPGGNGNWTGQACGCDTPFLRAVRRRLALLRRTRADARGGLMTISVPTLYSVQVVFFRDGKVGIHQVDNVTEADAGLLRIAYTCRDGDGLTFDENSTGEQWFYGWDEIRDVNIAPLPA